MKRLVHILGIAFGVLACTYANSERILLTITEGMTLQSALQAIADRSGQPIYVSKQDASVVKTYRFPIHMIGVTVKADTAGQALSFLFGSGWEGSPIAAELRDKLGEDFKLARTPPQIKLNSITSWTCNNRYFDWKQEGKGIRVIVRLQPDGDIIKQKPFGLELLDEATIDVIRDLINQRVGIYFNIIPEEHKFMPSNLLPQYKRMKVKEPFLVPMRVAQLSLLFGAMLEERHTLGEWLTMLAEGLNLHCRPRGCLWKWSAWVEEGKDKPIYTLRCYAHPYAPQHLR
ncbi:MAG: hypothetical protein RMK18_03130 [Armatimonadota bacterium]|nr:hypothetical protein [Armatimonadota bacterium]MCX7778131.1 hypothetical protein [Armatimonadota bacterium]MDW8024843.1 hypothetical protein [Armatimonadota bacterium]